MDVKLIFRQNSYLPVALQPPPGELGTLNNWPMWEIAAFSRKKKPKNGVEQKPETDERHKQGIETLKSNGICAVDALHEAVYSAGVERRPPPAHLPEGVPPVAGLKGRPLDQVKDWLNKWQHHH